MTSRQNTILVELGTGGEFVSAAQLVRATQGAPWASIRRDVSTLRKAGYNIQSETNVGGFGYRLPKVAPARNITLADLKADLELGEDTLPGIDPYEEGDDEADVNDYDDGGW